MIQEVVYLWKKTTVFNRQVISAHKRLMCCERIVVGLKLPEDGVNNTKARRIKN